MTASDTNGACICVGANSGTSLDGIDAFVFELHAREGLVPGRLPRVLAHEYLPYEAEFRADLEQLCAGATIGLHELGRLSILVARAYVAAITAAIHKSGHTFAQVAVVGVHGQTVHHQPVGSERFTIQIGEPNTIAVALGIPVVSDFHRRDMALGGQGAPLVPGFHDLALRVPDRARVVLNCGGIANVTLLLPGRETFGFDVGPANVLIDAWIRHCGGEGFDADGAWARSGVVVAPLLDEMLREPFFAAPFPKSTGRELFNLPWVLGAIERSACSQATQADVQRTLLALSIITIAEVVRQQGPAARGQLLVCGGGTRNGFFMQGLAEALPAWEVSPTDAHGIPAQAMEAMAFAAFAVRTMNGLPSNEPAVTGASRRCMLGNVFMP